MLFRNVVRKYYNAAGGDGAAGGGAGAGAGAGGAGAGGAADTGAGGLPANFDYDKFAAAMVKAQKGGNPDPKGDESAFDKLKREQDEKAKQGQQEQRMRGDVAFDLGFNALVEANKASFALDAESIRKGVGSGLDGSKQVEQLKVTAAKAFFAVEANLAMLSPADKAHYDQAIKGRHDSAIDADKAWQVVERALHVKGQLDYQNKTRGAGAADENKGKLPMMDAYLAKCQARCRPKSNQ